MVGMRSSWLSFSVLVWCLWGVAACTVPPDSEVPRSDAWEEVEIPDIFNPADKPEGGCGYYGYGYGQDCPEGGPLDCRATGCSNGVCEEVVDADAGATGFVCVCDEGYTGPLCSTCAPGFAADGTRCVPESGDVGVGDVGVGDAGE